MIDPLSETLVTMAEASALLPSRPAIPTLWRWRSRGVQGRKLESVTIGGRTYTSHEALARFAQHHGESDQPHLRTPSRRERDILAAERELAEAGI